MVFVGSGAFSIPVFADSGAFSIPVFADSGAFSILVFAREHAQPRAKKNNASSIKN